MGGVVTEVFLQSTLRVAATPEMAQLSQQQQWQPG